MPQRWDVITARVSNTGAESNEVEGNHCELHLWTVSGDRSRRARSRLNWPERPILDALAELRIRSIRLRASTRKLPPASYRVRPVYRTRCGASAWTSNVARLYLNSLKFVWDFATLSMQACGHEDVVSAL